MKKLTAMLFALMLAASMSIPAFAAGQSQGETPSTQDQTTQGQTTKRHKKSKKKKSKKHHKGTSTSPETTPPPQ